MMDRFRMTGACGRTVIVLLLSFLGAAARGQTTYTWTDSASGNFSDPLNWDSGGVPTSSVTSMIQINAADPASFTLSNDLGVSPLVLNGFMLNSNSTGVITVSSPDPFQLGGTAPNITMAGSGAFSFVSSTDGVIF